MQMKAKSPDVIPSSWATSMYFLMDSQGTEKVITETHREGDH